MKNKKGYFQIIEILLAVMLAFFVISFVYTHQARAAIQKPVDLFPEAMLTSSTRQVILEHNSTAVGKLINSSYPEFAAAYDYALTFNRLLTGLETKEYAGTTQMSAYSVFVAGNGTAYEPTILRVYFWKRT